MGLHKSDANGWESEGVRDGVGGVGEAREKLGACLKHTFASFINPQYS